MTEARWYTQVMGDQSGYNAAHHQARKHKADECERCGSSERLEVALRPDADPDHLEINESTGCRYSHHTDDYMTLCRPCHMHMDLVEGRTHCARGHEWTPENTSTLHGKRRCLTCHREDEAARLADPEVRARKNAQDRTYRKLHPMTAEQKARKLELQRIRRARQKGM